MASGLPALGQTIKPFAERAARDQGGPLRRGALSVFQINVGKRCNQTCAHCHVDAGPRRTEIMDRRTAERCMEVLAACDCPSVDLTGGAPELNPHFRWLVERSRELGRRVMDRCNLTVLLEPGHEDLGEFLARNEVEIISSLPCYLEENVDGQRGRGVFQKSIEALRRLNALGYGVPGSQLTLSLVYNPVGQHLPPPQEKLAADYRRELGARYGISFNNLLTITNMPIARHAQYLNNTGQLSNYMELLANAYNPATLPGLMCRTTLSVGWDGRLYDCDFNQMLEIPLGGFRENDGSCPPTIFDPDPAALAGREIAVGEHCYGCTAGAGSSCGGALT